MDEVIPNNGEFEKATQEERGQDWLSSMPTTLENDEKQKRNRIFNNAAPEMALSNTMNTPRMSAMTPSLN